MSFYSSKVIYAAFEKVYFYYPETQGRSLEELDVLFAKANELNVSPVKMAKTMEKLEGPALERELARYFGEEALQTLHPEKKIQRKSEEAARGYPTYDEKKVHDGSSQSKDEDTV